MTGPRLTPEIETLTQRLGNEMFERMRGGKPTLFQSAWWEERMLQQCMRNEWLKVQAFRFIDVLPMMSNDVEIARHLREYLVHPDYAAHAGNGHAGGGHGGHGRNAQRAALAELEGDGGPNALVRFVSQTMSFPRLDSLRAKFFSWLARKSAVGMAGRFIAGSNVEQAERAIRRMREQGMAFTIDVLGEAAVSRAEAEKYQQTYLDLITALPKKAAGWAPAPLADEGDGRPIPRVNVSVKLTSIHPGFDPVNPEGAKRVAKERLRPLLRAGMQGGAHIHIDMEHYAIKDLTLDLCRELFMEDEFRHYPHFGIVLQAYLKDGDRDAEEWVEYCKQRGAPMWVRLVKGAYWDSETVWSEQAGWPCPVWEQKWQSDACYERMTRTLMANHEHVGCAFASHNVRSLSHAMALQRLWGVPRDRFELQMLYGMGDPIKVAAVEMGERCRIYTPYGELLSGMAYLIRRLLENTANESFLRHSVDENTPVASLLRDPEEIGRETPPFEKPAVFRFELGEPIMEPFENTPNTDFSRPENREAMQAALRQERSRMGGEIPLVIGGQRVRGGAWRELRNPSRPAEVVAKIAIADGAAVDKAVKAAATAFSTWRRTTPHERAEMLLEAAKIMKQRRFELAALQVLEVAKPWREADGDISEAVDYCTYYAREMMRLADHPRRRDIAGETNEYVYEPRGVAAVIGTWSFPTALLAGMASAALVTGDTVVLKPASAGAASASRLVEIFEQAGMPAGVVNLVMGEGETVGEALVKHAGVSLVAFTGSRTVGHRLYKLAAESQTEPAGLKKFIGAMGGKNAVIVDSDADVDEVIKGVIQSAFAYAGQKCTAASRLIVVEPLYDRFVERFVEAARGLSVGPAEEPGTFVPAVIDKAAWDAIRRHIETGKREAKLLLEVDAGKAAESGGFFVGPVIFGDVPPSAKIAREEIYGPVLAMLRAGDIGEAIAMFNDCDYALSGGIYSRSPANLERARHECVCGNFYINRKVSGSRVDLQPFGGTRMSGLNSKVGGPDYLIQFCEPRTISENTLRRGFAPSEEVADVVG